MIVANIPKEGWQCRQTCDTKIVNINSHFPFLFSHSPTTNRAFIGGWVPVGCRNEGREDVDADDDEHHSLMDT